MTTFESAGADAPPPQQPAAEGRGAAYWVLDSWNLGKAIVHGADCPFCQGGTHRQGRKDSRTGAWYGPFSRDEAFLRAGKLSRKVTRGCKSCAP